MDNENASEIPREIIQPESIMKPNGTNNRKKRGRPSVRKENENNSDNVDKSSKASSKPSPKQTNEEINEENNDGKNTEDVKISSERTLRKRKNRHRSDNSDRSSASESSEKHTHKEDTESSTDDRDKNDNEYIGRADSQPRRSSRRIAVISSKKLAKGMQNNPKNENEETASKSTESLSLSDYSKRNSRPGSFKKKAVEVLSRWNSEEEFKHEYNKFYHAATNHLPRIPKMGWLEVDIYKLFKITISKGGYHEVTKKLLWKDVYKSLNNTNIVSNAATTIRSHYRKLLLNFEDSIFRPRDKNLNEALNKTEPDSSQSKDLKKENGIIPQQDQYNSYNPLTGEKHKYKEFTIDSIINGQKEISRSSDSIARFSDIVYQSVVDPSCVVNPATMPPPFDDQRRNLQFSHERPPFPGFFEYGNDYRPNYYVPPCYPPMSPYHMERMNNPEFQHRPYLPPMFENYDCPRYYNPNGPYPGHYMPPPPPPPHNNFPTHPNGYPTYPFENPQNNFPPQDRYFPNRFNPMYPPYNRSPPQNR